jgi:Raf kinase inhibitor-like YbhB/YbcL family protein
MKITSPAFQEGSHIPSVYTCEGKNVHPPLQFQNVPGNAISLVLIMDDPDVPASIRPDKMYDHWIVFNMPANTPGITDTGEIPGIQGKSTNGKNMYVGPCPPFGEHRYFFKLYALDIKLKLPTGATKKEVEQAMNGHIMAEAQLVGLYEKKKPLK